MKYLMIAKMKEKPPMSAEELLKSSVMEWETALRLKGMKNVEAVYAFADQSGGLAIGDVDSEAQARALMAELPFYRYLDINLSPIISAEDASAKAKHDLEAFKAQKQ